MEMNVVPIPDCLPDLSIQYESVLAQLRERIPQLVDLIEFSVKDGCGQLEIAFGKPSEKIVFSIGENRTIVETERGTVIATFLGDDLSITRLLFRDLGAMFRTRVLVLPNHIHSNPILSPLQETNFFAFTSLLVLSHDWQMFEYLCQQLDSSARFPKNTLITDLSCDCSRQQKNFAICIQCLTHVLRVEEIMKRDSVFLMCQSVHSNDLSKSSLTPENKMWPSANFIVHLVKWMARPSIDSTSIRPRVVALRFRDYTPQFQKRLVIGFDAIKMLSKDGLEIYRWNAPFDSYYIAVKDLESVAVVRDFDMNIDKIITDTQELFELAEMAILRDSITRRL